MILTILVFEIIEKNAVLGVATVFRKFPIFSYNRSMATRPYKAVQKHPRVSIPGHVLVHDEEHFYISPLANVSAGGLFTDQRLTLTLGATVRVVIKSPEFEHPVQALGTVVRIEQGKRKGIAIEFTSISRESRERIQTCVTEQKIGRLLETDQ